MEGHSVLRTARPSELEPCRVLRFEDTAPVLQNLTAEFRGGSSTKLGVKPPRSISLTVAHRHHTINGPAKGGQTAGQTPSEAGRPAGILRYLLSRSYRPLRPHAQGCARDLRKSITAVRLAGSPGGSRAAWRAAIKRLSGNTTETLRAGFFSLRRRRSSTPPATGILISAASDSGGRLVPLVNPGGRMAPNG